MKRIEAREHDFVRERTHTDERNGLQIHTFLRDQLNLRYESDVGRGRHWMGEQEPAVPDRAFVAKDDRPAGPKAHPENEKTTSEGKDITNSGFMAGMSIDINQETY